MSLNKKGQVGPMSLEDIFPMVVVIIIVFVFIAMIFNVVGSHLEQRSVEAMHGIAVELLHVLCGSQSSLVYGGNRGLLDSNKLDHALLNNPDLNQVYGITGYRFSMEVDDLVETERKWNYTPADINENAVMIASPVAIRYREDRVHEGLIKIQVWRK